MALTDNQLALIKLYLAGFNRAPEKGGFDYWSAQMTAGKSFSSVVSTIFSLDVVKAIYPDALSDAEFVTKVYNNVFGKTPDAEGLAYWSGQLGASKDRGALVMTMINVGLATSEGTPGKAFIANRYSVAQHAVDQQTAQKTEIPPDKLKEIMAGVSEDSASATSANSALDAAAKSGGLEAPKNAISVAAAANGISKAEKTAGVSVMVDLTGTGAEKGDTVELLLDGASFTKLVTHALTAGDITAHSTTLLVTNDSGWGSDGIKTLSAKVKDSTGHAGTDGGSTVVTLDTTGPTAPTNPLAVEAAEGGVNISEKTAGVEVVVDLTGTHAAAGDTVALLIGGAAFAKPVTHVLTDADVAANSATLTIGSSDGWGVAGNKILTAQLTDQAGNPGTAGGSLTVALKTTAPGAPSSLTAAAAMGGINTDEEIAGVDVVVNLAGTNAAAGDTVEMLIDGKAFATPLTHVLSADEATAHSVTLNVASGSWGSDGNKTLTAKVTDAAGNAGLAGGALKVTLDTTAPSAPTNPLAVAAALGGISTTEKGAGVAVVMDLAGTNAAAGDTVALLLDDKPFTKPVTHVLTAAEITAKTLTITVPSSAGWGEDGNKTLTAVLTDAAGNVGTAGGALAIILGTTPPGAPTNPIVIAAATGGINAAEKGAGVAAVVDLTGTNAAAGDTVEILIGGVAFGKPATHVLTTAEITAHSATVTIASSAGWGLDGAKTLSARVKSSGGDIGAGGGNLAVTLDGTAPGAPSAPMTSIAAAQGVNNAEKTAGVDMTVNLNGTSAVAGETLEILIGGVSFSTPVTHVLTSGEIALHSASLTIASSAGWGVDGVKPLTARVTDLAGNVGIAGGALSVTIDTGVPGTPTNPVAAAAAANGINASEKTAGVAVVVDLTGTSALAGDKLEIMLGGASFSTPVTHVITSAEVNSHSATATIASTAGWGADGTKSLSARVTDIAGNVGTAGGPLSVNLVTTAPSAPTNPLSIPAVASTGRISSSQKAVGVDVVVDLAGTGAATGDSVTILIGGLSFATPVTHVLTASEITAHTATLTIPSTAGWGTDGGKTLTARVTDAAGNVGVPGGMLSVTLDTAGPGAPSSAMTMSAAVNGLSAAEIAAGVTTIISLNGTNAAAGDTLSVLIGGSPFSTPVTQVLTSADISAHSATLTIPSTAGWGADGSKVLTARVTDVAGNNGTAGGKLTVVVDTTAPGAPTNPIAVAAAAGGINSTEKSAGVTVVVDLTGTNAATGDKVEILIGGASFSTPATHVITAAEASAHSATMTISGAANWGADGSKTLTAQLTDVAGNAGTAGGSLAVTLNTTPPGPPTNPIAIAAAANGINAAEKAAGVSVVVDLTGTTASAGDTVSILIGGVAFTTPVNRVLTSGDITANSATLTIPSTAGWSTDGSKTLTARVTNVAGNSSTLGGSLTVNLDTNAPGAPTSPLVVGVATNGISAAEVSAGVSVIMSLNGTNAVAGDTAEILIGGASFSTPVTHVVTSSEASSKSATIVIDSAAGWGADGSKTLTGRVTDIAGNVGNGGGTLAVTLNTSAPSSPSNSITIAAAANGISAAEKTAGVAVVIDLTGTGAVAGDTAEILIGGVPFGTPVTKVLTSADISSHTATVTIGASAGWGADGGKTLAARIKDVAGNIGTTGSDFNAVLDTTVPGAPSNALVVSTGNISAAEKSAGVDVVVDLTGTSAVAGDSVSILLGGAAFTTPVTHVLTSGEITANSVTLTIPGTAGWGADGSKTLTAKVTDVAGNAGTGGGSLSLTLDTITPAAPTSALSASAASNGINAAEIAAGVAVVMNLTGTNAVAGDTAEILLGGAAFTTPVTHVLTSGEIAAHSATITIGSGAGWGADGSKTLTARVADAAGNVGTAGGSLAVTVDTTLPALAVTPLTFVDNTSSASSYDATDVIKLFFSEAVATASIGTPTLGGTGSPNLGTSGIAAVGASGGYATEFDITLAGAALSLSAGATITLVGIDAAGNQANVTWTLA